MVIGNNIHGWICHFFGNYFGIMCKILGFRCVSDGNMSRIGIKKEYPIGRVNGNDHILCILLLINDFPPACGYKLTIAFSSSFYFAMLKTNDI